MNLQTYLCLKNTVTNFLHTRKAIILDDWRKVSFSEVETGFLNIRLFTEHKKMLWQIIKNSLLFLSLKHCISKCNSCEFLTFFCSVMYHSYVQALQWTCAHFNKYFFSISLPSCKCVVFLRPATLTPHRVATIGSHKFHQLAFFRFVKTVRKLYNCQTCFDLEQIIISVSHTNVHISVMTMYYNFIFR